MTGKRPEDIGSMAESFLKLLAKDAGYVANAATDDKAGWDFELEEPSPLRVEYSSQARRVYRIQVKATSTGSSSLQLTFSNLLALIQFSGPSFLLLLRFNHSSLTPHAAYLLHINEDLSKRLLKSLRQKQLRKPDLKINLARTSLKLPLETRIDELTGAALRAALENAVGRSHHSYVRKKSDFLRSIEQESQRRQFSVRFQREEDVAAMAECFLGYERPFTIDTVSYVAPMGLPDRPPKHTGEFYQTSVKPLYHDQVNALVRFSHSPHAQKFEFASKMYVVPKQLSDFAAMRFESKLFDLVVRVKQGILTLQWSDFSDPVVSAPLSEVRGAFRFLAECGGAPELHLEIEMPEAPLLKLALPNRKHDLPEDLQCVHKALEAAYPRLAALELSQEIVRTSSILAGVSHLDLLGTVNQEFRPRRVVRFTSEREPDGREGAVLFCAFVRFEKKTALFQVAVFGTVTKVGTNEYEGSFERSQLMGELVISNTEDIEAAEKPYGDQIRNGLRKAGVNVVL